jgi:MarR family transcriptional regulator for hemolysin
MATQPVDSPMRQAFLTELSVAGRKMRTLFDGLVRRRGLSLSRARLLLHLARTRGANQTELAAVLELERPTVVRLLDGLEKQGLIRRQAVDGDRRAKQVALTEMAGPEVAAMEAMTVETRARLLAGIEEGELEVASRVLARLIRNIEAHPDPSAGPPASRGGAAA